jgi:type IV pilus assembly protein PilN
MTRINLLPWREMRRAQRQRDLIILLVVAALVAVGIVYLAHSEIASRIEFQQQRNEYLRGEIARLKKAAEELAELQKTKNRLIERINVIQKLQASRPGKVRMLDELVRLIPEDIFLTSFNVAGNQVKLNGTARSDLIIAEFMREIKTSDLFGEPALQIIQTKDVNKVQARVFELTIPLKLEADQEGAGGKR